MLNHNIISEIKKNISELSESLNKLDGSQSDDLLLVDSIYVKMGLIREKIYLYRSQLESKRYENVIEKVENLSKRLLEIQDESDLKEEVVQSDEILYEIDITEEMSTKADVPDDVQTNGSPQWMLDRTGYKIDDINSVITLNDKLYFINDLFGGDYDLFKDTVDKLNSFSNMDQALMYCRSNFPHWDEYSNEIYRFYMILRRRYL